MKSLSLIIAINRDKLDLVVLNIAGATLQALPPQQAEPNFTVSNTVNQT